ncbi:MAG: hypothetical protein WCP77_07970 [Roseococcus sp.]
MSLSSSAALSPVQMLRVSAFAVLLWISGAVLIRLTIPLGVFSGGVLTVLAYAIGIAINVPTIWLARLLGGLRQDQIIFGMALGSGVAILCDGLALTWAPGLYGGVSEDLHRAAAWLLWTVAFGLIGAFIVERRG